MCESYEGLGETCCPQDILGARFRSVILKWAHSSMVFYLSDTAVVLTVSAVLLPYSQRAQFTFQTLLQYSQPAWCPQNQLHLILFFFCFFVSLCLFACIIHLNVISKY